MKKIILFVAGLFFTIQSNAGGLLTNQNQSASYVRSLARGASTSVDAVFYNPAGLMGIDNGLSVSLNNQFLWQTRTITDQNPALHNSEFEGNLMTPLFPSVYATYKIEKWAFSFGFNPTAGGGSVTFDKGIPMIESGIAGLTKTLAAVGVTDYSLDTKMDGRSIFLGYQAGVTYKIADKFGVYAGARLLSAKNMYEGNLTNVRINPMIMNPSPGQMMSAYDFLSNFPDPRVSAYAPLVADQNLYVKQTGRGFTPILGFHFSSNNFNIGIKYEFNTNITIKNNTSHNAFDMFPDGQELRSDVPAMLSLGLSYDVVPEIKLSVGYINYFDKKAKMEAWDYTNRVIYNKADLVENNSAEYLAAIEWTVTEKLLLSMGYQYSDVSVKEAYQTDIAHSISNLTGGIGLAYKFCDNLTVNVGGLLSIYGDSKVTYGAQKYGRTYDRTSKGLAIGLDFKF